MYDNDKLWQMAVENIKQKSREDINIIAKEQKTNNILSIVFYGILFLVFSAVGVFAILSKSIFWGVFGCSLGAISLGALIGFIVTTINKDDDYYATLHEYNILKKRTSKTKEVITKLDTSKTIREVFLLDIKTVVTDKLHAVLNYQEIIQTRVGVFKVIYTDGTEQILEVPENSDDYLPLMSMIKQDKNDVQASNADELRKYKSLMDDGIISQEEFNKKKHDLLN